MQLELDCVEEGVRWFATNASPTFKAKVKVDRGVSADGGANGAELAMFTMNALSPDEVAAAAKRGGATVRATAPATSAGPEWIEHRYFVQVD